ncbi:unnamed protein product, partial [Closterium sp. NIES-54]
MATPTVLTFDAEGCAVDFEVWLDDLQLFLQCDRADGLSLFDLTSGASPALPATADSTVRSQRATRDAAARLAVRHHLPTTKRAHFSQYKSAQTLYDAVVARYSFPATAALSRLMLLYLFPDLAAFPTVADLITHLRTSDTRYRAALPAEDHFLSVCPTTLTVDLLEERLLAAEQSIVAVGASRGDPCTPIFEGCSPSPLLPSVASAAAADLGGFESVGAASAPSGRRRTGRGKGGKGTGGTGGGGGGGGGGNGGGWGGGGRGGEGGGVGSNSGGGGGGGGGGESGGGGGGRGGGGGGGGGGSGGAGRGSTQRSGSGGGQRQHQQRSRETPSPQQLREWYAGRQRARLQPRESFGSDFLVQRLHSDRGGKFSSALLGAFCCAQGIRQTFTLPASPQQNGIAERRIGMVMDVARTSMIHAAAPHFLWLFEVQYAAHQLNLQPWVSLPETSPTLRWTGKVGDASAFRVWGSRAFVRDLSADKLSPRAVPCVFLGFPPDAPGWQFYHLTSRRVLSSQDVSFDESVPYYRLFPYRTAPLPPPPLFLAPDAVEPVELAVDSGAARGAEPGGAESGGAESGGAEPGGAEPGGAESGGAEPGGAEPGALTGGPPITTGPGGARTGGTGAVGTGGAAAAAGVGPAGASGAAGAGAAGGVGAGVGPAGGTAGVAGGTGAAGLAGVGAVRARGAAGIGAATGGPSAVPVGTGDPARPRPYFVPLLEHVLGLPPSPCPTPPLECPQSRSPLEPVSPLPAPSPYAGPTGGLAERLVLRRLFALLTLVVALRVHSESNSFRAARPTVARLLSTVVIDPSFESTAASALVAELVDFAARCRRDYATRLVAASESVSPPSVGGECALSTDVLEDREEEFQCFAAALPHLVSTLIALEGDPDAPDIPTPRSYAEAIE